MHRMTERRHKGKSTSNKPLKPSTRFPARTSSATKSNCEEGEDHHGPLSPPRSPTLKVDLRKEYNRFCKLYSSEPLDIVAGPLEKASMRSDSAVELDLRGRGLRGVDCIALGKILASNASIFHLNLSDCLLLPQGFQALLDGLQRNTTLKVLELRGNNIQTSMVENLSILLKMNHSLKQLLLEWNCLGISKQVFQTFCDALTVNKGLEYVDLRNNQITDESGIELASVLKHNNTLRNLDLRWNSLGVQGAKALWDALQQNNQTITTMELCGNFIPDEITRHIQSTLKQRSQKEAIIQDYSKRTKVLTSQLQKTEENYKSEIKSILHVFEDEEAGLKGRIQERNSEIGKLSQELIDTKNSKQLVEETLAKVQKELEATSSREKVLREALLMKTDQINKLDQTLKIQAGVLGSKFESKISKVTLDLSSIHGENDKLAQDLKEALATIKEKDSEVSILNNRIESLRSSGKKAEESFEDRLRKEKEHWFNWKQEVESNEHLETQRLQNQLQELQKGMQEHVKSLETKRAEAEEEVNRLKFLLLTVKTEGDENCSRLRNALTEQHSQAVEGLLSQIERLKTNVETFEVEGKRLDAVIRKLESDMGSLQRQNDHLKQHSGTLEEELRDAKEKTIATVQRAKNEVREFSELANEEQNANKKLRGQVLEMQEQIAMLTMKLGRAEKERGSEGEFWKGQIERRDEELKRLKEEDMRRAALLHDAFTVYMRSTSAATGLPIPSEGLQDLHKRGGIGDGVNKNSDEFGGKGDNN